MKNQIIAQVEESDRNIYITIEDGALVSVNYSQGLGDIDLHFLTTHNEELTIYVIKELDRLGDELYSPEFFFPSPYWDEQVKAIDDAIWKLIREENEQAELIESIMLIENEMAKLQNQLTELRNRL
jgi:hypothetical protein